MILQEAYQAWQQQVQNRTLFAKTREAFRKAWFQLPTNKPCSYYTKDILGAALAATEQARETKAKAVSVMIHVLTFANTVESKDNPKPKFTLDDLMNYTQPPASPKASKKRAAASPPEIGKATGRRALLGNGAGVVCEEKKPRTLRKHDDDICQIDPTTLTVIARWPHGLRVKQELGISNVVRAIERCGMAGGFYWTYSQDLDTFPSRLEAHKQRIADLHVSNCQKMRAHRKSKTTSKATSTRPPLTPPTQEGKPAAAFSPGVGGARGGLSAHEEKNALASFSDEALFSELERRGWHGYFSRSAVVTLGHVSPPE